MTKFGVQIELYNFLITVFDRDAHCWVRKVLRFFTVTVHPTRWELLLPLSRCNLKFRLDLASRNISNLYDFTTKAKIMFKWSRFVSPIPSYIFSKNGINNPHKLFSTTNEKEKNARKITVLKKIKVEESSKLLLLFLPLRVDIHSFRGYFHKFVSQSKLYRTEWWVGKSHKITFTVPYKFPVNAIVLHLITFVQSPDISHAIWSTGEYKKNRYEHIT